MSNKTDIWMPLYIGDYLAATTHLSAIESGGYLHLLMHQWKNGSLPASEEALRRIARIDLDAWSNAWAMLSGFFDHASGFPVQLRLEAIRTEWTEKKVKAKKKATAAAEARWSERKKNAPSNAQAMPRLCPSSSSSSSQVKEEASRVPDYTIAARVLSERVGNLDIRFQEQLCRMLPSVKGPDESLEDCVDRMVGQWDRYNGSRGRLNYPVASSRKFFESGTWQDEKLWPWKDGQAPAVGRKYVNA